MSQNFYHYAPLIINGTTLAGMRSTQYAQGIDKYASRADGKVSPILTTGIKYAPRLTFSTEAVAAALTLLGLTTDIPFVALASAGAVWQSRKIQASSPAFTAGTVHEQGAIATGTAVMTGIEAPANQPAIFSGMVHGYSDGSTHPAQFSQVAAASDPTVVASYVLDSATIDSTSIDEVVSASLAVSYNVELGHGMKAYPTMARIGNVAWVLTVRHNLATIPRSKVDKDASGSFVLKNLNSGGPTRGSNTVTATVTGMVSTEEHDMSHGANSAFVTTVTGRSVSGAIPCTIALA